MWSFKWESRIVVIKGINYFSMCLMSEGNAIFTKTMSSEMSADDDYHHHLVMIDMQISLIYSDKKDSFLIAHIVVFCL